MNSRDTLVYGSSIQDSDAGEALNDIILSRYDYSRLNGIPDWRRQLSTTHRAKFEVEGQVYSSIVHYLLEKDADKAGYDHSFAYDPKRKSTIYVKAALAFAKKHDMRGHLSQVEMSTYLEIAYRAKAIDLASFRNVINAVGLAKLKAWNVDPNETDGNTALLMNIQKEIVKEASEKEEASMEINPETFVKAVNFHKLVERATKRDDTFDKLQTIKRHELKLVATRGYRISSAQVYQLEGNEKIFKASFVEFDSHQDGTFEEDLSSLMTVTYTPDNFAEFREKYQVFGRRDQMSTRYSKVNKEGREITLGVIYLGFQNDKLSLQAADLKQFYSLADDPAMAADRYLLIGKYQMNHFTSKTLADSPYSGITEFQEDVFFSFDLTLHSFAPVTMNTYDKEEAIIFVNQMKLGKLRGKLPRMLQYDPQLAYRDIKAGGMVHSEVASMTEPSRTVPIIRDVRKSYEPKPTVKPVQQ